MPITRPSAPLVAAAAILTLAACGSNASSGPKPQTAAQVAAHYDSLAFAVAAGGSPFDSTFGNNIGHFNGVIADGQLPSTVQMTVGGTTQTWYANFVNVIAASDTDSVQVVFLWPNTQATSFVAFGLQDGNTPARAVAATQGGDFLKDSIYTITAAFVAGSGACTLSTIRDTAVLTNYTQFGPFTTYAVGGETCTPATATITTTAIAKQGDATVTAALQSLSLTQQTIKGVRLVLP